MLVLFIREVHPSGSSGGEYPGLLALFYIAYKSHHLFADYFRDKRLVTLLGTGFFSYFIAVTTDQRFWKFIPAEKNILYVPGRIIRGIRAYSHWLCVVVCYQEIW